jgi:hypothetical protein
VDVFRREVTASEDASLVNPLTGEPTAEREKWIATLQTRDTSGDPLPEGALSRSVVPVYFFDADTGELRPCVGVPTQGGDILSMLANHIGHSGIDRHPSVNSESAGFMTPDQLADLESKAESTDLTALDSALTTHKTSSDHDGRYFTETESNANFAPKSHVGAGGAAHSNASTSTAGFMAAADKTQLNDHETRVDAIEAALPGKADDADVTAVSNALNTHKSSSDHDSRYFTETECNNNFAPKSHVGSVGTSQHPAATHSTAGFMESGDKTKLDDIQSGAEVNQLAFSNILVKGVTVAANSKTGTVELNEGPGITLTPDAANRKVTLGVAGLGGYTIMWRHADGYDIAGFYSSGYGAGVQISPQGGFVIRAAGWNNNWMYSMYVKALQTATISISVPRAGKTPHMFVDGVEKPLAGGVFEWTISASQTYLVQFTCCMSIDPDTVDLVVIGDWIDNVNIAFDHYA